MTKKPKEVVEGEAVEKKVVADVSVVDRLMKKYGDKAVRSGKEFLTDKKKVISVSPAIDIILGGGIPEGSFVIFTGDPKTGKTVTSLHFSGNCQRAGKKIFYLDIEGRLKQRDLEGIKGLDADAVNVIKSYKGDDGKGKIFKANDWLDMACDLAVNENDAVIILDSVSQLMTEDEATCDIDKQLRAPVSQMLSKFCKRVSNAIPINNNIIICIVHLIANVSGFGAAKGRSGGRKIQYEVDVDLEVKKTEPWKVGGSDSSKDKDDDDGAQRIGQKVHWITRSTALASAPGQKIVSWLRYGMGIDEGIELIELGKSLGLITLKGAWYRLSCMENHLDVLGIEEKDWEEVGIKMCHAQGQDKFLTLLSENPKYMECLREDVKGMLTQ